MQNTLSGITRGHIDKSNWSNVAAKEFLIKISQRYTVFLIFYAIKMDINN